MSLWSRKVLKRRGDGSFDLRLSDDERELIVRLMDDLKIMLGDESNDPSLRRLAPPTYGDDAVREAGYQMTAGDELRKARLAAVATVAESARREKLDEDEAVALAQSLNAVRLVLGTRLDITEENAGPPPDDDPDAPAWYLYQYLSGLLAEVIDALAA